MERSGFDRDRQRVPRGRARDDLQTGTVGGDTPETRVVVRDARPSHVRDASGLRALVGSRHRAARGSAEPGRDDVYDWLELVFTFCEGKPFVYYSQYVPSARIHALARSHKVRLRWCPLGHLSARAPWRAIASGTSSGWATVNGGRCRRAWRRAQVTVASRKRRSLGWDAIRPSRIRASDRGLEVGHL